MCRSITRSAIAAGLTTAASVLVLVLAQGVSAEGEGACRADPSFETAQKGEQSACIAIHRKVASPSTLLLGETTSITLTSRLTCPAMTCALRLALVLDGSGSMAGNPTKEMKEAAVQLIRDLGLPENPSTEVGVVAFNSQARVLTGLTNNEGRVVGALRQVGAAGGSAIDAGIKEGLKLLVRGRLPSNTCVYEVMVVLSDGQNNAGCGPVLQAANQAKGQGVLVFAVCLGPDCDEVCMRQVATGPAYYYKASHAGELKTVFDSIRNRITALVTRQLTIRDVVPDNMRLVPGSIRPEPESASSAGDVIQWKQAFVSSDGMTVSFQLEPLEVGYWPTNVEASGSFIDISAAVGSFTFDVPWVVVLEPNTQPTSAVTRTPSATPTATPTSTPTPTPRGPTVFLPLCYHE